MEEKEGINIDFYFILWEKYKEIYHSQFGVGLPHTIIYRNQYPIAWFFTNTQNQILKKRNLSLNNDAIYHHFTAKKQTKSDVLGYFIESDPDDSSTKITYFDEPKLHNPNTRAERGVLQQFIDPVGENNAMYRASWSQRTCIISKKVNRKNLFTKQLDIYERCCTFEGHHIFSDECPVSGGLLPGVINSCMNKMHLHIFALSSGNSLFKRADGFFKQDTTGKVWFLWNNSYRLQLKNFYGQKNYVSNTIFSSKLNMRPLSLEQQIKIPDWVEKGATYNKMRPNHLQKDLLCENCDELQKHTNFASISYKYLIQSREMKMKDIPIFKKDKEQQGLRMNELSQKDVKQGHHSEEGVVQTAGMNISSQNLNDVDELIDQINQQRVIFESSDKITIPQIFQKIHPKMTDYTYQCIKDNPKFYSKQFWVCQNCYLKLISYDQVESGCDPQINYKQIISSYYDFKPKALRKEFIKFQQECFNLFLEENKYQQTIWQKCTKSGNLEQYQRNHKQLFNEKLKEQQLAQNKRIEQEKVVQRNRNEKKKNIKTEEERQSYQIKQFREQQKRVQSHIDYVINSAQNSFINRPSTSMISLTKNNSDKVETCFKGHRRSESNLVQSNKQLLLEDYQEKVNYSYRGDQNNHLSKPYSEDINEYNSLHSTAHESQGYIKAKNYLQHNDLKNLEQPTNDDIKENDQIYINQIEAVQPEIKTYFNKNFPTHQEYLQNSQQILSNQISPPHLNPSKTDTRQLVLFYPVKKTHGQSPIQVKRITEQSNKDRIKIKNIKVDNLFVRGRKESNSTPMNDVNNDSDSIPLSTDRFKTKSTFQETGFQFRSRTGSQQIANSRKNNTSERQSDLMQFKSYLTSPQQSSLHTSKELNMNPQIKQTHSRYSISAQGRISKKTVQQLYLDNVGQHASIQVSQNQEYLKQNNLISDQHQQISSHQSTRQNSLHMPEQLSSIDYQPKHNVDVDKEIQEYKNNSHIYERKASHPFNNFQKIQFFPKSNVLSEQNHQKKPNFKNISTESQNKIHLKIAKSTLNNQLNTVLKNSNKFSIIKTAIQVYKDSQTDKQKKQNKNRPDQINQHTKLKNI